ncbi:hypothetical protein [Flammeovirga sp. SJP92]|uniref:hypothetical protein n=1 Tax=Flammeovirga sp. SJP92 TaxID=1775430 RepID=UPI000788E3D4|nr:hypothetical protein [Flammeovirga sp. SJP92]KXX72762.1 hypothetical protein AVL50_32190 [Flammeovirga sp. SJP92]
MKYNYRHNLVIGFHGCSKQTLDSLLEKPTLVKQSEKKYDWLGSGFYVWENNYQRALEWAKKSRSIKDPAVVGVVFTLGDCLDLTDKSSLDKLKQGHKRMAEDFDLADIELPTNKNSKTDTEKDLLLRELDCAVINFYYREMEKVDTVRGIFFEGGDLYPGAGIKSKTHTQIAIRNNDCILGFFKPKSTLV